MKKKNLTQTDLMFELDKIGLRISRPTLIHWEQGETVPDANEVAILANFFNRPIEYFFDQVSHLNGEVKKRNNDK